MFTAIGSKGIEIGRCKNGWFLLLPQQQFVYTPENIADTMGKIVKNINQDEGDLSAILEKNNLSTPENKKPLIPTDENCLIFKTFKEVIEYLSELGEKEGLN